jgi:prolyl-tRNA synthetase
MRYSFFFSKTRKQVADTESPNARFLEQAGFVNKEMAGVYTFLSLGLRVLNKIENSIRAEMNTLGATEILMPALHPKQNWEQTGRWGAFDALFKVTSQYGFEAGLGPTHEEIITPLATTIISSYKDLPKAVYQIQTKFRDEPRAKSGLLRGREFRMKDLYSFHTTAEDLAQYYQRMAESYHTIFKHLSLPVIYTEASGGSFSKFSHEFQVEIPTGEDVIYVCENCGLAKNKEIYTPEASCTRCQGTKYRETMAAEVGNIFELKNRFSDAFKLVYMAEDGTRQPVLMGCYGMGSTRIMGVLVEKFHDDKGIIWPASAAPFQVHLVGLGLEDDSIRAQAEKVYQALTEAGVEVLFDDRPEASAGEKFADADLIGVPWRVVVSKKTGEQVEVKARTSNKAELKAVDQLLASV